MSLDHAIANTASETGVRNNAARRPSPSWSWPFEARRIFTVHALQVALFFLFAATFLRFVVGATLWLGANEISYLNLAEQKNLFSLDAPLVIWLTKLSTLLLGRSLLAARLPQIVLSSLSTLFLMRLIARMGWAKGTDVAAILCLTTPILFLGGIMINKELLLCVFWIAAMETSYSIGMGYDVRKRAWMKLGVLLALGLAANPFGLFAVAASCLWLLLQRPSRALKCLALGFWGIFIYLFHFKLDSFSAKRWAMFWLAEAFLLGPVLIYGWFTLLGRPFSKTTRPLRGTREEQNLRFLLSWALLPGLVFLFGPAFSELNPQWGIFAFIPVLVHFAKLSISSPAPKLVRRAVSTTTFMTLLTILLLYEWPELKLVGLRALDRAIQ